MVPPRLIQLMILETSLATLLVFFLILIFATSSAAVENRYGRRRHENGKIHIPLSTTSYYPVPFWTKLPTVCKQRKIFEIQLANSWNCLETKFVLTKKM